MNTHQTDPKEGYSYFKNYSSKSQSPKTKTDCRNVPNKWKLKRLTSKHNIWSYVGSCTVWGGWEENTNWSAIESTGKTGIWIADELKALVQF